MEPRYPEVSVQLTGQDGNVFSIIGETSRALKRAGYRDEAAQFTSEAFDSGSYEEVLALVTAWVDVS